jgi:hypothetical protein
MADNDISVDKFVNTKVLPQFRPVVEMIRRLMRENAPDAREYIRYGIPNYKGKSGLAVISPTKKDITFAFSRGAIFEDKYDLLRGVGHVSKHIKLRSVDEVPEDVIAYYIDQAVKLDS